MSTADHPVVPDTSLRKLVSAFKCTLTFFSVMSGSNGVPNVSLVWAMLNNSLRMLYYKHVLTHRNEEVNRHFLPGGSVVMPTPLPIFG